MKALLQVLTSSLGKKIVMAVTGFGLVAFVIVHMLGNLQIFLGADTLNAYAKLLKSSTELLWAFRLGLLGMAVLHIVAAVALVLENRKARPQDYSVEKNSASWASRTMPITGIIVAAFVIFHILHFTVGAIGSDYHAYNIPRDAAGRPDVYTMVVTGFANPWISGFYILSVALLCGHMSHGVSSMFQSLGLRNRRSAPLLDKLALGVSLVVFLGMASVPAAILLNLI
jgi:succinate dehydrogenase / fumarate reductase cytochrome b subunit